MKKLRKKPLFAVLFLLAVVLAVVVAMTCSSARLFYFGQENADSVEASYLYLNEERTYTFEIDSLTYGCVEFASKSGSCNVEIIDADGEYLFDTFATGHNTYIFSSETDITVNLKFTGHSGSFRIYFSEEPIY